MSLLLLLVVVVVVLLLLLLLSPPKAPQLRKSSPWISATVLGWSRCRQLMAAL